MKNRIVLRLSLGLAFTACSTGKSSPDPEALAEWVLPNNPGWARERIEAAFKAQKEQQVNLTEEIPVLIVYGTAIAREDGQVYFFDDIYKCDETLGKLFAEAYARSN